MKVLIYSINYSPELTGIGKYNGELAPALVDRGIDSYVLTAPPYYPEWQLHKGFKNTWNCNAVNGVTVYRCPLYIPKTVTTLKRILHLISFAISSALRLLTLLKIKPDVLFLVQPTLFCAPAALLYCKLTGAKSILHIQDFEVDAMLGLGMAGHRAEDGIAQLARIVERFLLRRFDVVSSISYSMLDKARAKGVGNNALLLFPNWADTEFVTPEVSGDTLRAQWGFQACDKLVLYSGNIGKKQGLDIIIAAAKQLADNSEIKFVIVGSGAYYMTLQKLASEQGLTNVFFKPLQPWSLVPQVLAMADVHLVVQKRGAADAVLPSKLTNILSAGGHTLVTAEPDTELGNIAKKYPGIYHCVEPESLEAFLSGIKYCLSLDTRTVNKVARQFALENLNREKVIDRFVEGL